MPSRKCACGCGRPLKGQRRTRRYYSDACRKKHTRGSSQKAPQRRQGQRETRTNGEDAPPTAPQ